MRATDNDALNAALLANVANFLAQPAGSVMIYTAARFSIGWDSAGIAYDPAAGTPAAAATAFYAAGQDAFVIPWVVRNGTSVAYIAVTRSGGQWDDAGAVFADTDDPLAAWSVVDGLPALGATRSSGAVASWELDSAAAALAMTMPDLCDLYKRSGADEYGGGGDYGDPWQEGLAVSVEPASVNPFAEATFGAGRESAVSYFELAFPLGADVEVGDLVDVTTLGVQLTVRQAELPESWDLMVKAQGTVTS